jgi:hypothetical protein
MTQADFQFPKIAKQDATYRAAVPVEKRLALTQHVLAPGTSYTSLRNLSKNFETSNRPGYTRSFATLRRFFPSVVFSVLYCNAWTVLGPRAQAQLCTLLWILTCFPYSTQFKITIHKKGIGKIEWRHNLDTRGVVSDCRAETRTHLLWCTVALWWPRPALCVDGLVSWAEQERMIQ